MIKRVIPDRLFSKLWMEAERNREKTEYIKKYTMVSSPDYIDFKRKFNLKYEEGVELLSEIHEKAGLSFKEILSIAKKRKADISNTFCIPIRTVEEWYSGKNKCSSYVRLALLRHYHLINLGKSVYVQAEEEYKETIPSVYRKKEEEREKSAAAEIAAEEDDELMEIDDFLFSLRQKREKISFGSDKKTQDILDKTSFIDEILKNRKR